jgi:hypothetical protein
MHISDRTVTEGRDAHNGSSENIQHQETA